MSESRPAPLRIAIAGVGGVARGNYLPFLAAQPDVVLACWNRTPAPAEEAAKKFKAEAMPTLEALATWGPTAALVLTAETCRDEVGRELIERGVPRIFFEKPLVARAGQAHVSEEDFFRGRELLQLAATRGCETAMVFNYRFFEQTAAAREIVAARKFGAVVNITAQVHYACWSHGIDLIHHFAGGIAEIAALGGNIERRGDRVGAARDVMAAFRTEGGAAGTILGTAGMAWQHPLFELVFTFERGRIHLRDLDGTLEILDGAQSHHETISFARDASRWASYDASFRKAVGAYLQSLRDGAPPPVPGIDGLRELQVEAALRRSVRERRPVKLAEEFPLEIAR
ncbi:MAG TPA: Gfo/Idh/MocA family oxidoreductase [Opitutaceae bacterium]|nr:Gfo/Idh/MocA family oxidoreductase [Opitutaceae bacterium]